ncbi:MAG: DNA repair exonuclease [Eubacteriaceae bacterium]|nr:DNA repair exonuclease [Eubacteriaceae bacterium]
MVKFIHTADLHLGSVFENASFTSNVAKIRRAEMFKTFEDIVRLAMAVKDNFLLISGDLFEEKYCTAHDLKRVFDTLAEAKTLEVVIIAGNHDLFSNTYKQFVNQYPNIHIFSSEKIEKKSFDQWNLDIYGMSWDKSAYFAEPDFSKVSLDKSRINILMLHADIATTSTYLPINIKMISEMGFDYIALGHIHKNGQVAERAYYAGCPEALDFKETGERGIYRVALDKETCQVEFVKTANREFVVSQINLNPDMGYIDIIRLLTSEINHESLIKDMHRFEISGMIDSAINLNEIIEQVRQSFFYLEYVNNAIPDFDIEQIKAENEDNIIGRFIEKMQQYDLTDEVNREALYKGVHVLLSEVDGI